MSEAIEHIIDPTGKLRIAICARSDGHFECALEKHYIDDLPEYNHHREYWAATHRWGIFDSVATAKREAAAEYPWALGNKATNGS